MKTTTNDKTLAEKASDHFNFTNASPYLSGFQQWKKFSYTTVSLYHHLGLNKQLNLKENTKLNTKSSRPQKGDRGKERTTELQLGHFI